MSKLYELERIAHAADCLLGSVAKHVECQEREIALGYLEHLTVELEELNRYVLEWKGEMTEMERYEYLDARAADQARTDQLLAKYRQ